MTPATIPDVQSNDRSPSTHKCVATILVEHAVSIEKEGPRKPYMKDTRPAATESVFPVAMYGENWLLQKLSNTSTWYCMDDIATYTPHESPSNASSLISWLASLVLATPSRMERCCTSINKASVLAMPKSVVSKSS